MKTSPPLIVAAMILFSAAGCVPISIHPLYTQQDLLFEPALVGTWSENADAKETWTFEKSDEKEYRLVIREADGKTGEFHAHLLKLGNTMFLDLLPDRTAVEESNRTGYYQAHLQPMHSFLRVSELGQSLQMAPMSLKWLSTFLKENPQAIRHERIAPEKDDQPIILTASTRELQAFVLKHLNTPDAFGDEPIKLERRKSKP